MKEIDHTNTPTQHIPFDVATESCQTLEITLEPGEELHDFQPAHHLLAESLDLFMCYQDQSLPTQQGALKAIINRDAQRLSDTLLQEDATLKPMLADIFLLIRAYDVTNDTVITSALDNIFIHYPPVASQPVAHAFYRARKQHIPILPEYLRISRQIDANIEAIDLQREADEKQQAELLKELNRREAEQQQRLRQARKLPHLSRQILRR